MHFSLSSARHTVDNQHYLSVISKSPTQETILLVVSLLSGRAFLFRYLSFAHPPCLLSLFGYLDKVSGALTCAILSHPTGTLLSFSVNIQNPVSFPSLARFSSQAYTPARGHQVLVGCTLYPLHNLSFRYCHRQFSGKVRCAPCHDSCLATGTHDRVHDP